MQKKVLQINDVSGGLNTKKSESDIDETQCVAILNSSVSNAGLVTPLGGFDTSATGREALVDYSTANQITHQGFNVGAFSTDVSLDNSVQSDTFVSFLDVDSQLKVAFKSNSYAWENLGASASGLTGTVTGAAATGTGDHSYVDTIQGRGAVRYTNSNFSVDDIISEHGSTKLWYGHIKRNFADSEIALDDYFVLPSDIVTPTSSTIANGVHNNNFDATITAPTQGQFVLEVDEGTSAVTGESGFEINTPARTGSLTIKDSIFYMTFTYDGNQESLPYKCGPHLNTITGNDEYAGYDGNRALRFRLNWYPYGLVTTDEPMQYEVGGPRITHVNIYRNIYSPTDTSSFANSNFEYITSFNLEKGWETEDGGYSSWTGPTANVMNVITGWFSSSFTQNFRLRNSYSPTEKSINCRWKTSTKIRNTLYVGNVYMEDEFGIKKHYPDRMMKSIPNKFDTFPNSMRIDVSIDDGDSIVKLSSFGGKILQFKKKVLNIINATKQFEFLEASIKNMGVDYDTAVTDLKSGVAFANAQGIFIYNGKEVVALFKDKISDRIWENYYSFSSVSYIHLFYTPIDNNIIIQRIAPDATLVLDRYRGLVFNITTQSFTSSLETNSALNTPTGNEYGAGNGVTMLGKYLSPTFNLDNNIYQGYMKYSAENTLSHFAFAKYKQNYNETSSGVEHSSFSNSFEFKTKIYNCGNASTKKKLRRIQIRYKMQNAKNATGTLSSYSEGDNTNLKIYSNLGRVDSSALLEIGQLTYQAQFKEQTFDAPVGNKDFNTIQIIIQNPAPLIPVIHIDTIEVVYKEKRLK